MGKTSSKLPPKEITDLLNRTHFTEQELKDWHIGFKRDCPEGRLSLQQFTDIYSKFYGTTEAKKFAEHLFRTFDTNHDGTIGMLLLIKYSLYVRTMVLILLLLLSNFVDHIT